MRKCKWSKRELTNAVLYLGDTGCKWRQLPHDFPPYSTVHSFYRRARINGLWNKILKYVVKKTRINAGRKESPSYAIIDSQSGADDRIRTCKNSCPHGPEPCASTNSATSANFQR